MVKLSLYASSTLILLLVSLTPLGAFSVQAQSSAVIGDRVRVTVGSGRIPFEVKGTLVHLSPDTLAVETASSTLALRRAGIRRLEVSRGRNSHPGKGALIGAAGVGLVMGIALSASIATCDQSQGPFACIGPDPATGFLAGALLGGLIGAGSGAILGLFVRTDKWEQVPVEGLSIALMPGSGTSTSAGSVGLGGLGMRIGL